MPACICGCQCVAYPFALEKVPLLPLCAARHELVHLCLFRLVFSWDLWIWLTDCLIAWLLDCLIDWMFDWWIDWLLNWLSVYAVYVINSFLMHPCKCVCMYICIVQTMYTHTSKPYIYIYICISTCIIDTYSNEDLDPGVTSVRHCEMAGKNKVLFAGTMVCTAIYVPKGLWTLMSLAIESWPFDHFDGKTAGLSERRIHKLNPFQSRSLVWSLLWGFIEFVLISLRLKCVHVLVIATECCYHETCRTHA